MLLSLSTLNYAAPPGGHFWRWSREGDAIEWATGGTLALWPEIHTLLEELHPAPGLPPLGSILLLVAACRDDWEEVRAAFARPLLESIIGAAHLLVGSVLGQLDKISVLPKELRGPLPAKCLLAQTVFERGSVALLVEDAGEILRELGAAGVNDLIGSSSRNSSRNELLREFRALHPGLKAHDTAALESILRRGLPDAALQTPDTIAAMPFASAAAGALLDHLAAAGGEAGSAAAIARQTIAMLGFPGQLQRSEDLPVGGISDITNRGSIDRLLPGELAWDDLTLAARLVHQEALYFRREIPPSNVMVSHTVLLSRELRLWGAGRVMSLGVALGLRHHPDLTGPGCSFECVAATEEDFEYLDLETAEDIQEALEPLVPLNGARRLVETWLAAAQRIDDAALPEVVLILAAESLEGMENPLSELAGWLHSRGGQFRVISLGSDGSVQMDAWRASGNRNLFHGNLDLSAISRVIPPAAKGMRPAKDAHPRSKLAYILPIYKEQVLPIAFPFKIHPGAASSTSPDEDGLVAVSEERHLLHWARPGEGGRVLLRKLGNRTPWTRRHGREHIITCSGSKPGDPVEAWRWDGRSLQPLQLEHSRHPFPRDVAVSGDALIIAYSDKAEAFSLADGKRIAESSFPEPGRGGQYRIDGNVITRLPEERKTDSPLREWQRAASHPVQPILKPERVAMIHRVLWIACGEKTFLRFDPQNFSWQEGAPSRLEDFSPLKDSNIVSPGGDRMKVAHLNETFEVWYDSIGLLHLKRFKMQSNPWTVLLSQPLASVWHRDHGLTAYHPGLLLDNDAIDSRRTEASSGLKEFLRLEETS